MLTKDIAICIRTVDYSETSQIVTFFTKANGKISAIAKGSKRPKSAFGGPIEFFSHGRIVFTDSSREKLATLTELEPEPGSIGFTGIGGDLFVLNCCYFAAELLNKMTHDYDPHPELFDSFLLFLQNAAEQQTKKTRQPQAKLGDGISQNALIPLILFQLSLLKEVGLQPVLNCCANCKSQYTSGRVGLAPPSSNSSAWHPQAKLGDGHPHPDKKLLDEAATRQSNETYFSSSANGIICMDCEASFTDKIRLSPSAANCLSNLKFIAEVEEKTLNEIEGILITHFTELLGSKPKMAKHILNA